MTQWFAWCLGHYNKLFSKKYHRAYSLPCLLVFHWKHCENSKSFISSFGYQYKNGLESLPPHISVFISQGFLSTLNAHKCAVSPASGHDVVASIVDPDVGLLGGYHHLGKNYDRRMMLAVNHKPCSSLVLASQSQTFLNGSKKAFKWEPFHIFCLLILPWSEVWSPFEVAK